MEVEKNFVMKLDEAEPPCTQECNVESPHITSNRASVRGSHHTDVMKEEHTQNYEERQGYLYDEDG